MNKFISIALLLCFIFQPNFCDAGKKKNKSNSILINPNAQKVDLMKMVRDIRPNAKDYTTLLGSDDPLLDVSCAADLLHQNMISAYEWRRDYAKDIDDELAALESGEVESNTFSNIKMTCEEFQEFAPIFRDKFLLADISVQERAIDLGQGYIRNILQNSQKILPSTVDYMRRAQKHLTRFRRHVTRVAELISCRSYGLSNRNRVDNIDFFLNDDVDGLILQLSVDDELLMPVMMFFKIMYPFVCAAQQTTSNEIDRKNLDILKDEMRKTELAYLDLSNFFKFLKHQYDNFRWYATVPLLSYSPLVLNGFFQIPYLISYKYYCFTTSLLSQKLNSRLAEDASRVQCLYEDKEDIERYVELKKHEKRIRKIKKIQKRKKDEVTLPPMTIYKKARFVPSRVLCERDELINWWYELEEAQAAKREARLAEQVAFAREGIKKAGKKYSAQITSDDNDDEIESDLEDASDKKLVLTRSNYNIFYEIMTNNDAKISLQDVRNLMGANLNSAAEGNFRVIKAFMHEDGSGSRIRLGIPNWDGAGKTMRVIHTHDFNRLKHCRVRSLKQMFEKAGYTCNNVTSS